MKSRRRSADDVVGRHNITCVVSIKTYFPQSSNGGNSSLVGSGCGREKNEVNSDSSPASKRPDPSVVSPTPRLDTRNSGS
ncbi:hypothetical protein L596_014295 [Steinernema carpocapsae]|uniref:Uncharacterized protein n=1 Tax=Steinernema carpocapsae TaxID=34508 RepID=A0A4U5NBH5_STECR|nr:hypothetical protein L596_014295 [Steinernema carpocapsae]